MAYEDGKSKNSGTTQDEQQTSPTDQNADGRDGREMVQKVKTAKTEKMGRTEKVAVGVTEEMVATGATQINLSPKYEETGLKCQPLESEKPRQPPRLDADRDLPIHL